MTPSPSSEVLFHRCDLQRNRCIFATPKRRRADPRCPPLPPSPLVEQSGQGIASHGVSLNGGQGGERG